MQHLSVFAVLFTALLAAGCARSPVVPSCERVRAAFDLGSGSTKLKVARVDVCRQVVLETLKDTGRSVGYRQDLSSGDGRNFSAAIREQGLEALRSLKQEAKEVGATDFTGVATAAFRSAENAPEFLSRVEKDLGVKIRVITQREEALLGFAGAMAKVGGSASEGRAIVVWDIGGGSMQIVTRKPDRSFEIYEGEIASVTFKDRVIRDVLKKDPVQVQTPNPLSESQLRKAQHLAMKLAEKEPLPAEIRQRLKAPEARVLGIGGVHFHSIRKGLKIEGGSYGISDLTSLLRERREMSDAQIGGDYAATEVTNVALVAGFMKALEVSRVEPLNVTLSDGVLVDPDFGVARSAD